MKRSTDLSPSGPLPRRLRSARAALGVLAVSVLMILPPAAAASDPGDENPSVNQYVESVPTAGGDEPTPRGGPGHNGGSQLPASTRRDIREQAGSDAPQLEAISGSPALGAPPAKSDGKGGKGSAAKGENATAGGSGASAGGASADDKTPSILSASASATFSGGEGGSLGLLIGGLVLVTAVTGGVALVRRRARTR